MTKDADTLKLDSVKRRRNELRSQLRGLVGQFGYATVRGELLKVKRFVEEEKSKRSKSPKSIQNAVDYKGNQEHLLLWACVEQKLRESPSLTVLAACKQIAKEGGISFIGTGAPGLGLSTPPVLRRIHIASTIYREWKRANAARQEHEELFPGLWDRMAGFASRAQLTEWTAGWRPPTNIEGKNEQK